MDISQDKYYDECWYRTICENAECNPKMCVQYNEMKYLMESSNLPKAKQKAIKLFVPDKDRQAYERLNELKHNIYDFVQDGKNLYIGSEKTGTGKTSWAIKLMHNYFDCVWDGNCFKERAIFVHVPTFLMKCKEFKENDTKFSHLRKVIMDVDLVVWDDIASTDMSSYDVGQLMPFIDYRMLSEYSNIFTSNYADRELLSAVLGERMTSRVWSNNSTEVILFKGGDIR